jgi:hypothetical protein
MAFQKEKKRKLIFAKCNELNSIIFYKKHTPLLMMKTDGKMTGLEI